MEILLLIYLTSTLVLSAIHLSLLKGKKIQWLALCIPSSICLGFYKFSLSQNNQTLDWLIQQENLVSAIAIVLTFEAILIVFLTILQIKSYYKMTTPSIWKWISVIPYFQLIVALVFFQTFVFLKISGYAFPLLSLGCFASSIIILSLLTFGIQISIKKWSHRAEMQALLALFQLLLAMFLPLIARGQKVNFTQITVDYAAIAILIFIVGILGLVGYIFYKRKNKQLS
ncbi:MAG: hypothetical protein HRT67_01430 [Flavobacteriaceae bacterium]|nr:hypothetical protein [Flavobacteriaceae bacterium]